MGGEAESGGSGWWNLWEKRGSTIEAVGARRQRRWRRQQRTTRRWPRRSPGGWAPRWLSGRRWRCPRRSPGREGAGIGRGWGWDGGFGRGEVVEWETVGDCKMLRCQPQGGVGRRPAIRTRQTAARRHGGGTRRRHTAAAHGGGTRHRRAHHWLLGELLAELGGDETTALCEAVLLNRQSVRVVQRWAVSGIRCVARALALLGRASGQAATVTTAVAICDAPRVGGIRCRRRRRRPRPRLCRPLLI